MRISVYLPLLLTLLVALPAPGVALWLPPAAAARCLTALAVACAASTAWSLTLLAATLVRDVPPVIEFIQQQGVPLGELVPTVVAVLALLVLTFGTARLVLFTVRRVATLRAVQRAFGRYGDTSLLVSNTRVPYAFTVPARPGRIVVSTGLLAMLDTRERRAVIAHETAHLRHRHHRYQLLGDAAAALNPLLAHIRDAISFQLERWADEHASATVSDRDLVARTIARVALAGRDAPTGHRPAAVAFGAAALGVRHRVIALGQAPVPRRRAVTVLSLVPATAAVVFTVNATVAFLHWAAVLAPLVR